MALSLSTLKRPALLTTGIFDDRGFRAAPFEGDLVDVDE